VREVLLLTGWVCGPHLDDAEVGSVRVNSNAMVRVLGVFVLDGEDSFCMYGIKNNNYTKDCSPLI
jgi:hypothetical protein